MSEQIEQQNNKVQPTTEETTVVTEQVAGFQVVNEGFTTREAIEEAKRCLHCKVPQCKKGCPIGNDIPDFVHELSMGNMGAAMSIINAKSNLPAICGRVCPHEKQCQGQLCAGQEGKTCTDRQVGAVCCRLRYQDEPLSREASTEDSWTCGCHRFWSCRTYCCW